MEDAYAGWLKIKESLDQLDAQKKDVIVSPAVYNEIHRLKINLFGLMIRSSPLFPFETHWDACDILTRTEIKIPSGEWIHGVMMSPMSNLVELVPSKLSFAPEIIEEDRRSFLNLFKTKGRMF